MMVILKRPLTAAMMAELRLCLDAATSGQKTLLLPPFVEMILTPPPPAVVNYQGARGKPQFTPPEVFYWPSDPQCSDCVWMIPAP